MAKSKKPEGCKETITQKAIWHCEGYIEGDAKEIKTNEILKDIALETIEGLTGPDITTSPEEKLEQIYSFAHIARGSCEAKHEDWWEELAKCNLALRVMGIIG